MHTKAMAFEGLSHTKQVRSGDTRHRLGISVIVGAIGEF
jgi:hypothetical protein